ncbi:MAG: Mut7-C RNAse domain-containing protein [Candidatus Desulfatibia sp.]|uniref:Mut7-C RNAse domain-containing protein n=1 Tax=Candidatus Desulfatibia sp. TaxID=3101189 RepID=UPI002F2E0415
MVITKDICFTAETTLGKLAKWLRILGFDTVYQAGVSGDGLPDPAGKNRILLTRTKRVRDRSTDHKLVFINSNDPYEQVREVLQALGIGAADTRPFSRCTRCNILTRQVDKDAVRSRVPDYVWETNSTFQICSRCRRIYWPGSHIQRSYDIIKQFFETGNI